MSLYSLVTNTGMYQRAITEKTKKKAANLHPYIANGSEVLDVGCGNLYVARKLASLDGSLRITGLDRKRFPEVDQAQLNGQMQFVEAFAESMPFEDDRFDVSYCLVTLHHLQDDLVVLSEMRRVTKPDGRVIVLEDGYSTRLGRVALCLNDVLHNCFKPEPSFDFGFRDYQGWSDAFERTGLNLESSEEFKVHHGIMTQYQFCLRPEK
jgi:ubiquinone/menaquinone biosynthesis C-methylase UbiE